MIFSIVAPAALVATFMVKSEIVAAGSIKNLISDEGNLLSHGINH